MATRWLAFAICLLLARAGQAAVLRVSAEPPLSAQRLGDALRSYVASAEVATSAAADAATSGGGAAEPGVVSVALRHATADDAELVLLDGEVTIFARLPGAMRVEDLYRTAALKVQSLLERRTASRAPAPAETAEARLAAAAPPVRDRVWLDAALALLAPSGGPLREGLRLGLGMRFARRWRLGCGAYLEPPRSTHPRTIEVSAWELPFWLSLGYAWHQQRWLGFFEATGQLAVRRLSAEAPDIVSHSDTTLSPRAGGALGAGVSLGPGLRAEARVSLLAALVDTRYRIDGQVVWPAAQALLLVELGLAYGLR